MNLPDSLKPCTDKSIEMFKHAADEIIEKAVSITMDSIADAKQMGSDAREKIISGFHMIHYMLESIMIIGDPALMTDQLNWGKDRLSTQGISPHFVLSTLEIYRDIINRVLPGENAVEIIPYIKWMIDYQKLLINT
ncbi:MAG: hypothetical protein JXR70_10970 [Spirochaetales bacterium]|nr:hypothetical protein [Spirochaetales bacterium]